MAYTMHRHIPRRLPMRDLFLYFKLPSKAGRDERSKANKEETLAVHDNCGSHMDETVVVSRLG